MRGMAVQHGGGQVATEWHAGKSHNQAAASWHRVRRGDGCGGSAGPAAAGEVTAGLVAARWDRSWALLGEEFACPLRGALGESG